MSLVLFGRLAFLVLSLAIGVRLLLLARQSRQLPELLLGLSCFFGGFLGSSVDVLRAPGWLTGSVAEFAAEVRIYLLVGSAILMALLAWKAFRPTAAWAGFAAGGLSVLATAWVFEKYVLAGIPAAERPHNLFYMTRFLWITLCYLWPGVEAWRFYWRKRKRLRIGLDQDAVVVNRAFMLSLAFFSIGVLWGSIFARRPLAELGFSYSWETVQGPAGLLRSLTLYLAFFPPLFYRKWLQSRVSQQPETSAVAA